MSKPDLLMPGAYPDWDMAPLERDYTVHRLWQAADRDSLLNAVAPRIRAIATRGELGASAALMARLPALEIVSCYGVGTDAIDLAHARAHGIRVTNTPDVLTEDVADFGMALLLATARNMVAGDAHVRQGKWAAGNMALTTRVHGKRVGIVGLGRIGRAFAQRAAAFGCALSYCTRNPVADVPWPHVPDPVALAGNVDVLVVTVSGGAATANLISRAVLEALGPDGIFINISRGSTVDEAALLDLLEARRLRAAGLDVFRNEPRIDPRFFALDNVVLQPHHGSGTVETRRAMGQLVRDNLAAHFAGAPLLTPVV